MTPRSILARERGALDAHRATLRGGELPPPADAPRGTFAHGLLLPLSILAQVLRTPELRGPFLRITFVRWALLAVAAALVIATGSSPGRTEPRRAVGVTRDPASSSEPLSVDAPGVHIRLGDEDEAKDHVVILGQTVQVSHEGEPPPAPSASVTAPPPPPSFQERARDTVTRGWAGIVALVGTLSAIEFLLVALTRRWDDWLSFHVSRLAWVRPEVEQPPHRKVSLDIKWLWRKLRRRIRGYILIASGMPLLAVLELVPVVGHWLFAAGFTLWAWYWVGVFTASKSAHAWADDGRVPAPPWLRKAQVRVASGCLVWPLRAYGRVWAWVLRGVSAPAETFERSPAPFLGLALARAVFALPGLYVLVRPIVPVAAGRLCAEADPQRRFAAGP
ncbi:MAG TPA: hypothetical protein VIF09_26790 [Polyangiaceae bacterium]